MLKLTRIGLFLLTALSSSIVLSSCSENGDSSPTSVNLSTLAGTWTVEQNEVASNGETPTINSTWTLRQSGDQIEGDFNSVNRAEGTTATGNLTGSLRGRDIVGLSINVTGVECVSTGSGSVNSDFNRITFSFSGEDCGYGPGVTFTGTGEANKT